MKILKVEESGQRLDIFLSRTLGISRNQAQIIIAEGRVLVNQKKEKSNKKLEQGSMVRLLQLASKKTEPQKSHVEKLFRNDNIIVVDKAPGIVVYPGPGHESGTLLDSLRLDINYSSGNRPGIVHRLDKDTSGLMVIARNEKTAKALMAEIKERRVVKKYLTLVWGHLKPEQGTIDIPLARSESERKKIAALPAGRSSQTSYTVLKYYKNASLLEARILTGRTHQIRVHFSSLGFPVVGDRTYGRKDDVISPRQFLHACFLQFKLFDQDYSFSSPLPADLASVLGKFEV